MVDANAETNRHYPAPKQQQACQTQCISQLKNGKIPCKVPCQLEIGAIAASGSQAVTDRVAVLLW
jgi:hypothetical protein